MRSTNTGFQDKDGVFIYGGDSLSINYGGHANVSPTVDKLKVYWHTENRQWWTKRTECRANAEALPIECSLDELKPQDNCYIMRGYYD